MRPQHLNCVNTPEGIRRINEEQRIHDENPEQWEQQRMEQEELRQQKLQELMRQEEIYYQQMLEQQMLEEEYWNHIQEMMEAEENENEKKKI